MNPYYPAPTSGYIGPSYGPQPGVVAGFQNYYQYCNLSQSLPKEKTTGAEKEKKKEKNLRVGGGKIWEDRTLADWPEDDYRVFVGDLGNEVTDDVLLKAFSHYSSVNKARVIRDKVTNKSKGFGFVSLSDPVEFLKALKDMNGVYVGNRPCKVKKSDWKKRDLNTKIKKNGKEDVAKLVTLQQKGASKKLKKRKPRPENANRDELRKKSKPEPRPYY